MATADGKKTGGRRPGSRNKRTQQVEELLEAMKCNPIEGMAKIALGDADCHVCQDGRVSTAQFYKITGARAPSSWSELKPEELEEDSTFDLTCPICGGTGKAPVDTKLRGDMFKELAQYIAPKRKAVEVSQDPENPIMTEDQIDARLANLAGLIAPVSGPKKRAARATRGKGKTTSGK